MKTLEEAKQKLRNNFEKGMNCPCCGQFVRKYKYNFFATSAVALIDLYNMTTKENEFFHISKFAEAREGKPRASHFAELRFWGLAIPMSAKTPNQNSSGMWSITEIGKLFVEKKHKVHKSLYVFNNTFMGFDGKMIDINEALGEKFNYKDLMNNI